MASPTFDLDKLQKQMQTLLPSVDSSSLCCCRFIDPSIQPNDHLDDCELRLLDNGAYKASSDSSNKGEIDENADPREAEANARRRKHRESMARLRRGWRTSIAALQQQEQQLQALLCHVIVTPVNNNGGSSTDTLDPLETMRRSYRELVEEQLQLQQENVSLEITRAHKEKYERLLERELVRVRTFNAIPNDG